MAGPRKRFRRDEAAAEENDREVDEAGTGGAIANPEGANPAAATRLQGMADIARRRAAHFANFKEDEENDDEGNVHVGGAEARTLGPWSSAVELVNQRKEALEKRQAKIREQLENDEHSEASLDLPGASWVPSRDPQLGPRLPCRIPSLERLCCSLVVEYLDCVTTLEGVPGIIQSKLAEVAAAKRKLSPQAAMLFAQGVAGEVVLPDCKELDKHAMGGLLSACASTRLEILELGSCGRGFGDCTQGQPLPSPVGGKASPMTEPKHPQGTGDAVEAFVAAVQQLPGQSLAMMHSLKLGGAYRLNNGGLYKVLKMMPELRQLSLPDASRLTDDILPHLPLLVPHLRRLDLTKCRGLGSSALSQMLPRLPNLMDVTLDGIIEVDDSLLIALSGPSQRQGDVPPTDLDSNSGRQGPHQGAVPASGLSESLALSERKLPLRSVSIAMCQSVTDAGVAFLVAAHPHLEVLRVDKCAKVTDIGLVAIATHCRGLKVLSACCLPKISDTGLSAIAGNGRLESLILHGAEQVTDLSLSELASHCKEPLLSLDLSFCRSVTSGGLGHLVEQCTHLSRLVVFGCSQLDNKFAHGHGNEVLAAAGIQGLGTAISAACA